MKKKKKEREKRIDYSRGALTCEQQPGYIISTRNNVAGNSFEIPVRKNSIIDTRKEKRKTRHQGKRITKENYKNRWGPPTRHCSASSAKFLFTAKRTNQAEGCYQNFRLRDKLNHHHGSLERG